MGMKWEMLDHEAQNMVLTVENDQALHNKFKTYYNNTSLAYQQIAKRLKSSTQRYNLGNSGYYGHAVTNRIAGCTQCPKQMNNAFRWLLYSLVDMPLEEAFPEHYETISQSEELTMSTINIETRTFVNNVNISELSDDAVFDIIAKTEAEVRRLEAIEAKPAKLQAKIDALKASIVKLGELVDAR